MNNRRARLEALESRDLLSVSPTEYAAIRSAYEDLELPCAYSEIDAYDVEASALSNDVLNAILNEACLSPQDDLIVVRTSVGNDRLTLDGNPLLITGSSSASSSLTIVACSDDGTACPLIVDTQGLSRAFSISNVDVGLANMTLVGRTWNFEADSEYSGLIRAHNADIVLDSVNFETTLETVDFDDPGSTPSPVQTDDVYYSNETTSEANANVDGTLDQAQSAPYGVKYYDNSLYMIGNVRVTLVLMESDGTSDTNVCDWTNNQIVNVKSQVREALDWWETTFDQSYPDSPIDLSFTVDYQYADTPVTTSYEPISHSHSQDYYWVGDFLRSVGYASRSYTSSNSCLEDLRRFNSDVREDCGSDWAFTIFVVNSRNVNGQRVNGGELTDGYFGYTWRGGPSVVMTYDNDGWGISRMHIVAAHEIGHIFFALDEYDIGNAKAYALYSGYYHVQNTNSITNPTPGFVQQNSIMADGDYELNAYNAHTSSVESLQMIGWRDADNDGLIDALDVPMSLTNPVITYNAVNRRVTFSATSKPVALKNLESSYSSITLNAVDALQVQIDGGAWQTLSRYTQSGQVNVSGQFSTSGLNVGEHTVSFRTICDRTGVTSNAYSGKFVVERYAPPAFIATVLDTRSVQIQVDPVADASKYVFQVATDPNFANYVQYEWTNSGSHVVSDLVSDATYYVRAKTTGTQREASGWSSVQTVVPHAVRPSAPVASKLSAIADVSINCTFSDAEFVRGEKTYRLEYSTSSDFTTIVGSKTFTQPGTGRVSNLTPNTTYYFRVKTFTSQGDSAWSNVLSGKTKPAVVSAPTLELVDAPTETSIRVTFTDATYASGDRYVVQTSRTTTFSSATEQTFDLPGSFVVGSLDSNVTYYFRVKKTNAYGESSWSNVLSCTTQSSQEIGVPLAKSVGSATETTLNVSFSDAEFVRGEKTYRLEYSTSSDFTTIVGSKTFSQPGTGRVSNLTPNTTYYFRVKAVASYGDSAWSNVVSGKTKASGVSSPILERVDAPTENSLVVTYADASYAVGDRYVVQYSKSETFSSATEREFEQPGAFVVDSLIADSTYYFRVKKTNVYGESSWSNVLFATTQSSQRIAAPLARSVGAATETTLNVSFSDAEFVRGEKTYRLEYSSSSDFTTIVGSKTFSQPGTGRVSNLTPNTTYYFRVKAVSVNGDSEWSKVLSGTTLTPSFV